MSCYYDELLARKRRPGDCSCDHRGVREVPSEATLEVLRLRSSDIERTLYAQVECACRLRSSGDSVNCFAR